MANSDLYNKKFKIPDFLINELKRCYKETNNPNPKVKHKVENLIKSPDISYSLMKKMKNFFDNYKSYQEDQKDNYNILGGRKMHDWVNKELKNNRNSNFKSKKIKSDLLGQYNQFRKNHSKDNIKPQQLMVYKSQLFEGCVDNFNNAVLCVLINKDKKILILKRTCEDDWMPCKWGLPGGGVDGNEELEKALQREVKEETGINIKHFEYKWNKVDGEKNIIIHFYLGFMDENDLKYLKISEEEHSDCDFVSFENLCGYDIIPNLKNDIKTTINTENGF